MARAPVENKNIHVCYELRLPFLSIQDAARSAEGQRNSETFDQGPDHVQSQL
jgi:hypothetical protein